MKSKRILFITTGNEITASSRTRVYNYRDFLEESGFYVTIIPYNNSKDISLNAINKSRSLISSLINKINHFFKISLYMVLAPSYDIVFIQRVLFPKGIFRVIKRLSKKIVFDFDDAIYMADIWSRTFFNRNKFHNRFRYIAKNSDILIVSNEVLKVSAIEFNHMTFILPTPVDTKKLVPNSHQEDKKGHVVIGWMGSNAATEYLETIRQVLEFLSKKYPYVKIKFVGAAPLKNWPIEVIVKKWRMEDESEYLQDFDIGIMPLTEDKWTMGKAGYKLLQYMAVGIPCVASPIGANKDIVDDGVTGFFARTSDEWIDKLSMLIEDRELRIKLGTEGRKKAELLYSYMANKDKLIAILREAI